MTQSESKIVSSEIEKMREMIRELADMLEYALLPPGRYTRSQAFTAVVVARRYLAGPAYDFADPAQRREERNCGTSE